MRGDHLVQQAQPELPLAPDVWKKGKILTKQLSMFETATAGDIAWERRRSRSRRQERRRNSIDCDDNDNHNNNNNHRNDNITDDDLSELKGSIELGFGFNEEDGQTLCNTLPALDLYFAVNRQLSPSPVSTPHAHSRRNSTSFGNAINTIVSTPDAATDSWKICRAGDDPEHVKTKLRHWAQAVACSVMQSH
ncbi:hypothetical protein RJT34_19899 [Clitoria ternatea]|uniref:Uncharacterized protein n=1 Tax=Clitoria ternatea TaxID=43366 RepID=A0AAN9P559_CLITE